ncbi:ATP-dependent helicase [Peptacetobacter hominis]|uniref:DNA 3'-5' helicase n=1 Tax=Peptacetobacter hominis TaxID=2743610 RepID=A0A544QW32_9FIRM|nr:ATP-dependent helicase [Peptacetobacter hominis]TQQ84909.1 ATP-dependent helicase [Peptacetobacter hominis]
MNIENLNDNQKKAVLHTDGPCLVLAGPGSGKTRVITYRIANMVINENIAPTRILAISFTRASSMEMKNRVLEISNDPRLLKVTYGTFHSVFFRMLRYFENLQLKNILDEKEKRYIIRGIIKNLRIENADDDDTVTRIITEISYIKNELMDKTKFVSSVLDREDFSRLYSMYEMYKKKVSKIDFDDMLIMTYKMLRNSPQKLDFVRQVYRYILIDEFQDINRVQFEIIRMIASPLNNIFAVGDEDQSIYGFRGARPDFLIEFEKYFGGTEKILLDINYRSNSEIIEISNNLIKNNKNRFEKTIKCALGNGADIRYKIPYDPEEEASETGKEIAQMVKDGIRDYSDFAVIYRTNIQSRALVDAFMNMRIPFIVKDAAVTIYNHWAVSDIMAYLRLSLNPDIPADWERIINRPLRYIPKASIAKAKASDNFIGTLLDDDNLKKIQKRGIEELDIDMSYIKGLNPKNAISYIRSTLDYDRYVLDYCRNRKIKPGGIIEIINEFESSAVNFSTIEEFFSHIEQVKISAEENSMNNREYGVTFTTMHSAKGLEFDHVYIIGACEGISPHEKTLDEDDDEKKEQQIEEERRLMYVGITRARKSVCVSSPKNRYSKKISESRFVSEMKGIQEKRIKIKI